MNGDLKAKQSEATQPESKSEAPAKKEKKKSKKKDNDGLKRPLSAYMLFNNERRPLLRENDPCRLLLT